MKQTAVEFLENKLNKIKSLSTDMNGTIKFLETEFKELFEKAKEIESQQQCYSEEEVKSAFKIGFSIGYGSDIHAIDERNRTCEEWFEQFKKK